MARTKSRSRKLRKKRVQPHPPPTPTHTNTPVAGPTSQSESSSPLTPCLLLPAPLINRNDSGFLQEAYPIFESFYEAHTLQSLFTIFAIISVGAYWCHQAGEESVLTHQSANDFQQGLVFVMVFVLGYFVTQSRDGVLIRPHPIIWRFVHGMNVVYVMVLLAMLPFQPHDMRESLRTLISPSLGNVSVNTDYGEDCRFNWDNFSAQFFEFFTLAHCLGYVIKALVYRDWLLLLAHSILFELVEISFAHVLPNFNECWWDHLILDVFGANLLGSFVGMWLVKLLEKRGGKRINLASMSSLQYFHGTRRKARRILLQFTPLTWDSDKWELTHNSTHFLAALTVVACGLSIETSIFFLKYFLWIEMSNRYIFVIMAIKAALTAHAYREWYVYIAQDDEKNKSDQLLEEWTHDKKNSSSPVEQTEGNKGKQGKHDNKGKQKRRRSQRLGHNAWLCIAVIVAELAVCIKWSIDPGFDQPYPPRKVTIAWMTCIVLGCIWYERRYHQKKSDAMEKMLGIASLVPLALLSLDEICRTMWYDDSPHAPIGRMAW
jgi:phosphatidylserine synthase 2